MKLTDKRIVFVKNAEIVYSHKKHNGDTTPLAKRTNDFDMLEKLCREYGENAGVAYISDIC